MIGDRAGWGAIVARGRAAAMLAIALSGISWLLYHDSNHLLKAQNEPVRSIQTAFASYGRLPLSFEPNRGQNDGRIRFQARGAGYALYLTHDEAVLALPASAAKREHSVLELQFTGGNSTSEISGSEPLPGFSNYIIGNDPSRWQHKIPQFARVQYRELYPGVGLAFYGKQGKLEYDFDVAPGRDPRQIGLTVKGAKSVRLAENGDLVLGLNDHELRFEAPHVYQQIAGTQRPVSGAFALRGDTIGFEIGDYDRTRTLVIDPVLSYSTYLGGSGSESCAAVAGVAFVAHCPAVAVDSASRAYIAGTTTSTGSFAGSTPTVIGTVGSADVFVARLNISGTALDYVTYIGGSGTQYPAGVGVDSGFSAYVAGTTDSSDFPVTAGAFQATPGSAPHRVFLTKLDSTGSANLYTTYLSGSGNAPGDTASGLAIDSLGRAYLFGITTSTDFPVTPGALQGQNNSPATNQFFFSKVDTTASGVNSLLFSTFIGGGTPSTGSVRGGDIAVDNSFDVYLAGGSSFTDMPVVNAYQSSPNGGFDVWAAKLKAPATNTQQYTPIFETYLGGSGDDIAYGVATDKTQTLITGSTTSTDVVIPTATTPFQNVNKGATDAFLARFNVPTTSGTTQGSVPLSYFTYLGGTAFDAGLSITTDSTDNARIAGVTDSGDFPATPAGSGNPLQGTFGGGTSDAFVARIVTTNTSTTTNPSTVSFLGGSGADIGTGIALDSALNDYVTGETSSPDFPRVNPLQSALPGAVAAFASKIGPNTSGLSFTCSGTGCPSPAPANPTANPSPVGVGSQVTFKYSIYNTGDPVNGVVFTDTLSGTNSSFSSISTSPGACGPATGTSVVCNLGTVNTSSTTTSSSTTTTGVAATVTVVVTAIPPPSTGVQPPTPPNIGNIGTLSVAGQAFTPQTITGTATVNDFGIAATPASATVTAGGVTTYTVKVTPTGAGFPESVSLACGSGLPAQTTCSFPSNTNPIPNLSNGPQSRSLEIATQARVTTPGALFRERQFFYALWLPISGLALIGSGISRKRKMLLGFFFAAVLGTVILQAGCGYSTNRNTITTGTPAGTYTITVNATSGSATRTTTVQLTVQ